MGRSTIPADGVTAATTRRPINASAPHPWAARLWEEFLYSDQGQLCSSRACAHPARFNDLVKAQGDPEGAADRNFPRLRSYAKAKFASLGQQTARQGAHRDAVAVEGRVLGHSDPSSTRGTPAGHRVRPEAPSARVDRDAAVLRVHAPLHVPAVRRRCSSAPSKGEKQRLHVHELHHALPPPYIDAFKTSIEISGTTALIGGAVGLAVAYAAIREGTPRWVRSALTTFSGVAANFGGIPLAFAFISTSGRSASSRCSGATTAGTCTAHGFSLFIEDRRRARLHVLPAAR